MTTATAPMSIRLAITAKERLKVIAIHQKRTAHALATEAIEKLIAEKEREYAWNKSCMDALNHHDETGIHATHDSVMTWMDSMFTENELPMPVCHK